MAKVYVSSTRLDLEPERRAVIDWLVQADHQPAHSYVADTLNVRDGCLADVRDCDAYVLILGHRYGHVPAQDNPERLSITELEYRAAQGEPRLPTVVLIPKGVRDLSVTDINKPEYAKVLAFSSVANQAHKPFQFANEAELVAGLSSGLQKALRPDPLADPSVQRIITRLTRQALDSDDRVEALARENQELRAQLAAAIAHTLAAAVAPGAGKAQIEAAAALREGDSEPAQALLKQDQQAAAVQAEQARDARSATAAHAEAAERARERGALLMQTDAQAALEAFREATAHAPTDVWAWLFVGDLSLVVGDLGAAERAYSTAHDQSRRDLSSSPDDEPRLLRDLSVSHDRLGDVHVAQGDLPKALQAFEAGRVITEQLAARDPANVQWQLDRVVSCAKLGSTVTDSQTRSDHLARGLRILEELAAIDRLPPNQDWRDWFNEQLAARGGT